MSYNGKPVEVFWKPGDPRPHAVSHWKEGSGMVLVVRGVGGVLRRWTWSCGQKRLICCAAESSACFEYAALRDEDGVVV